MKLFPLFGSINTFWVGITNPFTVNSLDIGQDAVTPITIQFPAEDGSGATDMAGWQIEVAIQGGSGKPTGIEGDAVYAAYTGKGGWTWDPDALAFTGAYPDGVMKSAHNFIFPWMVHYNTVFLNYHRHCLRRGLSALPGHGGSSSQ